MKNPSTMHGSQWTRQILKYAETIALNPGIGGALGVYVYTTNGLYDPNTTGIGHQPTGFDQLMALYNEYVVIGSTIKVSFTNSDEANPVICGISMLDFATTDTDWKRYVENGNTTWTGLSRSLGGKDVAILKHQADMKKFSTQSIFSEDSFSGTSTANPVDTHYYHVWAGATDNATDVGVVYFNVEITYDAYFRDPSFTAIS